jgi:hypothetical protein
LLENNCYVNLPACPDQEVLKRLSSSDKEGERHV